jgi:hypothetical protein
MDESVKLANALFHVFKDKAEMNEEKSGAVSYALGDISSSVKTIYSLLIPRLLESEKLTKEEVLETLWDIRDEFRHIQYHIDDAKLTDL